MRRHNGDSANKQDRDRETDWWEHAFKFINIWLSQSFELQWVWVRQDVPCNTSTASSPSSRTSANASTAPELSLLQPEPFSAAAAGPTGSWCWQKTAGATGSSASRAAAGQLCPADSLAAVWQSQELPRLPPAPDAATTAHFSTPAGPTEAHHGKTARTAVDRDEENIFCFD